MAFATQDFEPPAGLTTERFTLEPLGPGHNEHDYEAWSTSIAHIRATPGFHDGGWPRPMTLAENHRDLERHATDFATGAGFTYTVLDPASRAVIGCVYIYPDRNGDRDAEVTSWVRASHAELDVALREVVSNWLAASWPFERVAYAPASA